MVLLFVVGIRDCWMVVIGIKLIYLLDNFAKVHMRYNWSREQANHQTSVITLCQFYVFLGGVFSKTPCHTETIVSCCTLWFDHTHSWLRAITHCSCCLWDSLPLSVLYPSPPTSAPWPPQEPFPCHFSSHLKTLYSLSLLVFASNFILLFFEASSAGLHLSGPNGSHHSSYTFGLSLTDKVKTSTGLYLWLIWFLFTEISVYSALLESFFAVLFHLCNWVSMYLQYKCVCACMTMSSLGPLMLAWAFSSARGAHSSSNIQLSVSTSKADKTKTAELRQQRSLDMSLSLGSVYKTLTWLCVCVSVPVYVCVWETMYEWESKHIGSDMMYICDRHTQKA